MCALNFISAEETFSEMFKILWSFLHIIYQAYTKSELKFMKIHQGQFILFSILKFKY